MIIEVAINFRQVREYPGKITEDIRRQLQEQNINCRYLSDDTFSDEWVIDYEIDCQTLPDIKVPPGVIIKDISSD